MPKRCGAVPTMAVALVTPGPAKKRPPPAGMALWPPGGATHTRTLLHLLTAACGRLCCKSLFAPLIANFSSCRRGFRVNMWGTSSPGDKLTGDFGNEPDATSISDRGLFRLLAGNLSPGVFRLLQHNRHLLDLHRCPLFRRFRGISGRDAHIAKPLLTDP